MCRDILSGGRRCPCDTSEARRLRKHNTKAQKKHAASLHPVMENMARKPADQEAVVEKRISISHEDVERTLNDIKVLRESVDNNLLSFRDPNRKEFESVTLSDGTVVDEKMVSSYSAIRELEHRTVLLGEQISQLAVSRTGITDQMIHETADRIRDSAATDYDNLSEEQKEENKYREETWPAVVSEDGKITEYHQSVFYKAIQNNDEDARASSKRYADLSDKKQKAWTTLNLAKNGRSPEVIEMLDKNRAEYLKIIGSFREIGGNVAVADNSHKEAVKTLNEVAKVYPKAWIDASNEKTPARIKNTKSRAHYSDGAYQKSFKVITKMHMITKPADWEPGPEDVGKWYKTDSTTNSWKDPDTNITYEIGTNRSTNEVGWVHEAVEWSTNRTWDEKKEYVKPSGRGWVETTQVKRVYNSETRKMEDQGMETRWYRPVKRRTHVSSVAQPELTISGAGEGAYRVGLHEFAHRIEASPKVGGHITTMEEAFLRRRTTNSEGIQQSRQAIYKGKKEYGRPDNFVDLYMGKEYSGSVGHREVLSTGAESVWGTSFGSLIGLGGAKEDTEMKSFILGLWASA